MKKLILNNKNYCGQIVEIRKIIELENCDNVKHVNIQGNLVIASKDVKEGDIGIYLPVECKLSDTFLMNNNLYRHSEKNKDITKKGYFEDNGRIKAVKFRGHSSNGLFIGLESLEFIDKNLIKEMNVGDEFNEINGIKICEKYVVKTFNSRGGLKQGKQASKEKKESKIVDGQFRLHYSTEQLGKNIHKLSPMDIISITSKFHGTSAVVSNCLNKKKINIFEKILKYFGVNIVDTEYGLLYSSRNVIKNEFFTANNENGFFDEDVWGETAKELYPFLDKGMTLYYEIVGYTSTGSPIQGNYDYGCKPREKDVYIYRITHTNADGKVIEYSAKQVQDWCFMNGFKAVKELYYGYAKDLFPVSLDLETAHHWHENFLEALREKYLEKQCCVCKNNVPDEGIVLRIENMQSEAFKFKSFKFLQKESSDLDKGIITMEDEN